MNAIGSQPSAEGAAPTTPTSYLPAGWLSNAPNLMSGDQLAQQIYFQNYLDAFPGQQLPGGLSMPVASGPAAPPAPTGPVQGTPTPVPGSPAPAPNMMGKGLLGALKFLGKRAAVGATGGLQ